MKIIEKSATFKEEKMMSIPMAEEGRTNISGIVSEYSNRLFRFIRSRVPNTADAEDILQEVWYQFTNVVDTQPIEQVSGWLFRVARNRITDRSRKRKDDLLEDYMYEDEAGDSFLREVLIADNDSPETEMLQQLFWEELFEALDELPESQKEVFVWNELEDQTFQEIADRTGTNIKTLISRKRYAVQHLRNRLQPLYEEFFEE